MSSTADNERIEIFSERELGRTLARLATQILETVEDSRTLMLLGIPTRGVQLSRVLARELERLSGHAIAQGCLLYTSPSPRDRQKSRMPSSA